MKKTEIGLAIIAFVSVVLGFAQVPSAFPVTMLSVGVLAMLYYPFGLLLLNDISLTRVFKKESYQGISILRLIGSGVAGVIFSINVIGFLFKVQFYPGATLMLETGSIGLVIVLAISGFKWMKGKNPFYLEMIKRTVIIGVIALIVGAMPYRTLVGWRLPDNPEYAEALINALENPGNMQLREIEQQERKKYYQREDERDSNE